LRIITGESATNEVSIQDGKVLHDILRRQLILVESFAGSIFGFAEVSGRPQKAFDSNKHFHGTIYAPLDTFYVFKNPLPAEEFADVLKIGQNTTTPMYGEQFEKIKNKLAMKNVLPKSLKDTEPTSIGFKDTNSKNWTLISCNNQARFINEAQLRTYLIDYLLEEIKDPRSTIHFECDCFRNSNRTGIADYFIKFEGNWVPVEAKLNVLAEEDLLAQISKYIHIDSFIPTIKVLKEDLLQTSKYPFSLIIDQGGIYLVKNNVFVNCSPHNPLYKREELPGIMKTLRSNLSQLIHDSR
jgi:hypothetical protein